MKSCTNCGATERAADGKLMCVDGRGAAWKDNTDMQGVCATPADPASRIARINALRCETLATYCAVFIEESCA